MGLRDHAGPCCEYKVARRAVLVTNLLVFLFALIFIGVVRARSAHSSDHACVPATWRRSPFCWLRFRRARRR